MGEWECLATPSLLERLPPIEQAPILEHLAVLGLRRFREEYARKTPLKSDDTVDYEKLVAEMRGLVSPDYKWQAPFFDEHHLHWEASLYDPDKHDGDTIPYRFRDLSTQKLWVPRQFHNFVHAVTIEPPIPERTVMREYIDRFRRHRYMYSLASEAIDLSERNARAKYYPKIDKVVDKETRRTYQPGVLEKQRQVFINKLEASFEQGMPPDLTELSILRLVEENPIEDFLPTIRRQLGEAAVCRSIKRKARSVALPIERSVRVKAA